MNGGVKPAKYESGDEVFRRLPSAPPLSARATAGGPTARALVLLALAEAWALQTGMSASCIAGEHTGERAASTCGVFTASLGAECTDASYPPPVWVCLHVMHC